MCAQRKAPKKVVTEEDLITANLNSFGDDIGAITNRVTAMFDVMSYFKADSEEYQILEYRIKCGQLWTVTQLYTVMYIENKVNQQILGV